VQACLVAVVGVVVVWMVEDQGGDTDAVTSSLSGGGRMGAYQRWASAILVRTSAIPQYCGLPNRLRNCGLKKVAELPLRTFTI
jgi:hypothetical protein